MTAEAGHVPNRPYTAQDGTFHLNGATVLDSTETDITTTLNLSGSVTSSPTELNYIDGSLVGTSVASKALVLGASKETDVLTTTTSSTSALGILQKLRLSPKPTDTYAGTMTIDVTYSYHLVAGANGTSATVTYTPSAAGTAGDVLLIETTATGAGTVTATFASTFHSSGTQATTLSTFSTILFVSDGTRWVEIARTTALA